jgi:hypothetical protein
MYPGSGQVGIPKMTALPAVTRQRSETRAVRPCIFQPFRYTGKKKKEEEEEEEKKEKEKKEEKKKKKKKAARHDF